VPYSSNPSITTLTAADIASQCGIPDAVLTITGVASGPYADEDLIGYTIAGKDPSNNNASTVWEVAVSGVTNTQVIAKKSSVLAQADDASGAAGTPITPLNVLANDTTDGVASTTTNSVLTVTTAASNPGVVLDTATGLLTTTAAVPAGSYPVTYQICNAALPTLCTQAVATVTVTGTVAPTTPTPVPTDSPWALLLAGAALAGAFLRIQAKK